MHNTPWYHALALQDPWEVRCCFRGEQAGSEGGA